MRELFTARWQRATAARVLRAFTGFNTDDSMMTSAGWLFNTDSPQPVLDVRHWQMVPQIRLRLQRSENLVMCCPKCAISFLQFEQKSLFIERIVSFQPKLTCFQWINYRVGRGQDAEGTWHQDEINSHTAAPPTRTLIEQSSCITNAIFTERSWPVGRRLSQTTSAVVNMEEEFIPLGQSPSFILAGQRHPKSSHVLEQMIGQKPNAWSAGEGGEGGGSWDRRAGEGSRWLGSAGSRKAADCPQALFCAQKAAFTFFFFFVFCFAPCKPK